LYRQDGRTKDEFKQDIQKAHLYELDIAIRFAYIKYKSTGEWPIIIPNGTDFTGQVVKRATSAPDFIIGNKLVEVTHSRTKCKGVFHQKSSKIKNCLKLNSDIIFVDGYLTTTPLLYYICHSDLQDMTTKSETRYGTVQMPGNYGRSTGKNAFKYKLEWCKTPVKLPKVTQFIPKLYRQLLEEFDNANK
jgi:hypothetical protein